MNRANYHKFIEEDLCLNCYRTGHHRQSCTYQGIIACSICFRANVFTQTCNCKKPHKPKPKQTLRFVEDNLMYIDVEIHGREFQALINTSSKITRIGNTVLNWLFERGYSSKEEHPSYLTIPIITHGQPIKITCKVQRFLENSMELGTDFLARQGFKFQLGNLQLDSRRSPIMRGPSQYEYLYNMKPWGDTLKHYLERKESYYNHRKRRIDDEREYTPKINRKSDSRSPQRMLSAVSRTFRRSNN